MTSGMTRRQTLAGALLAAPALALLQANTGAAQETAGAEARLAKLEETNGGRLGVAVLNLQTGKRIGHRADERFLMLSTFKALAAALVLARVDKGEEQLDRRIIFSREDLVSWSPGTESRVGGDGMTVAELCAAAVTLSDNTAANLILSSFGGPEALTAFARSLGDPVTRLDRTEPGLNEHEGPDDIRDTTTPAAMLESLRKLLFDNALSPSSRAQLAAWLITNKTGDERLRAGLPEMWLVGDKTGTNSQRSGNSNDIAVAWPPDRGPVIVTTYCKMPSISGEARNAVIAEVGRIAVMV